MPARGDGENAEQKARRAWLLSNWTDAAMAFGFIGLIIALDWVLNRRLTYVAPVAIGIAVGLFGHAVRIAWRRRSGRP
jgi:hypothetical protein